MSDKPSQEEAKAARVIPKGAVDCTNKVLICQSSVYDWNRYVAVPVDIFFFDLSQSGLKGDAVAVFCNGEWYGEEGSPGELCQQLVEAWFKRYNTKETNDEHNFYAHPVMFVQGTFEDHDCL